MPTSISPLSDIKALTFDVFGTVVDWRSGIIREAEQIGRRLGIKRDWAAFSDAWRALYQPSMSRVSNGLRTWTKLDELHRESLLQLLKEFEIKGLDEEGIQRFNQAWHRLDPWPDSIEGLTILRGSYVLATLSNGNVALLVNMAKRAGLPWDAVLGAEVTGHYKPQPEAYKKTAELLGLQPEQCLMVAAHGSDLRAAAEQGMRTAFISRPLEYGPQQYTEQKIEHDFDIISTSMVDLAHQLTEASG